MFLIIGIFKNKTGRNLNLSCKFHLNSRIFLAFLQLTLVYKKNWGKFKSPLIEMNKTREFLLNEFAHIHHWYRPMRGFETWLSEHFAVENYNWNDLTWNLCENFYIDRNKNIWLHCTKNLRTLLQNRLAIPKIFISN